MLRNLLPLISYLQFCNPIHPLRKNNPKPYLSQNPPFIFSPRLLNPRKFYHQTKQNMCTWNLIHFTSCGHNSGLLYSHGCLASWHQLMRINDPRERGPCFDWSDACRPQRGRNVNEYWDSGICERCQIPGWRFTGLGGRG